MLDHATQQLSILTGDCRKLLKTLPEASVHCCVTSPPYWGLRNYGHPEQLGQESTPKHYVENLCAVFAEVRRVLRADGTLWLNLSDTYFGSWGNYAAGRTAKATSARRKDRHGTFRPPMAGSHGQNGLKPKDLCGIPWRVALSLQEDGWYLRSDIIWHKPNVMPESVTDRPTKTHEYLFLLTKSKRYYYDAEAIKEPASFESSVRFPGDISPTHKYASGVPGHEPQSLFRPRRNRSDKQRGHFRRHTGLNERWDAMTRSEQCSGMRNKRSVWTVATRPYKGNHFATFPPDLVQPCIRAGTSERGSCRDCGAPWLRVTEKGAPLDEWRKQCGADETGEYHGRATKPFRTAGIQDASAVKARILEGMREIRTVSWQPSCKCTPAEPVPCTVLDPFAGSGTTGQVALELGRQAVLIELNPEYVQLTRERCAGTQALPIAA